MQVCPNCGEENPEKFRLCGFCGAQLAPALPPQETRKTVTIVFSDLKGSTNLGEALDSEALREVMNRYFEEMREALRRHGGTIEKYIGDAVMAVFGLPTLHEDDAVRAVRAAADMQRRLGELNDELERVWGVRLANRTGVNTGEVVAGDPTTGQRLITGDAVNVAARLEQAAPAMEILLGELTYRLVRDAVEVEAVEPLELKGKSERVPAYRLVSVAETGEGWARRSDAPMVGREEELARLLSSFDEAVTDRACRLVTVIGDAGVGKSRLHDEFMRTVAENAQILRGRCLSYGEGITFWPLGEAVRQAASIREDDSPDVAYARLADLAGDAEAGIVDRVAAAIGVSTERFGIDELFWGVRKLLETLAQHRPVVLLFDDVHWAATTFLELIEHLVDSVRDAPVLLLCPARHELLEQRPAWGERLGTERIVLDPLTATDTEQIVENLLGEAGIDHAARGRIVAAAEGNPLFVEQMLSMLIDEELLRFEDGRWEATSDLADLSVPPTIQALLSSRLDRLVPTERAVVEPASVIGHVFPEDAVVELAPDSIRAEVPFHLTQLENKHFVRPDLSAVDEVRFRFDHVLIREAAYNALLKRARATFHERFVEWADRVNRERDREVEFEEILGYHLEQAHRYLGELGPLDEHGRELGVRAAVRLASAGRRAFARGDMPAAANLLRRAATLFTEDDRRRVELLPILGESLMDTGEFAAAQRFLDEAVARSQELGDVRLGADAVLTRLLAKHHVVDDLQLWGDEIVSELEVLIPALEREEAHAQLAKAWRLLGAVHGSFCRWGEHVKALGEAIEHARAAGDARLEARLVANYSIGLREGPTPVDEAIRHCEEALARGLADRQAEALVVSSLARLRAMKGDFDQGRELIVHADRIRDELGPNVIAPLTSLQSSRIETLAGNLSAAERDLRRDFDKLSAMGDKYLLPLVAALLARAVRQQDRVDEATELAVVTEDLADDGDVETQAVLRGVRAQLMAHAGDLDGAERAAEEAVAIAESIDSPDIQGDCLVTLAEIRRAAGRPEDARAALTQALGLYRLKGNTVSAERTLALVADLPVLETLGQMPSNPGSPPA
jgi:class 3 adenylate cyclase/tetratricopeptide (TPR) repeat protein